jgi:hypothetical protein
MTHDERASNLLLRDTDTTARHSDADAILSVHPCAIASWRHSFTLHNTESPPHHPWTLSGEMGMTPGKSVQALLTRPDICLFGALVLFYAV